MGNTFYFDWEVHFMEWLQSLDSPAVLLLAKAVSVIGNEMIMIGLVGMIYWCVDKQLAKRMAVSILPAFILSALVKGALLRRRPYMDHSGIVCLRAPHSDGEIMDPMIQGFSFPSMHSTISASGFGTAAYAVRKRPIVIMAVVMPFLIGCSRFYLGVHYPTDVLSGWMLGAVSIFLLQALYDRLDKKLPIYAGIMLMALPGILYCRDAEYFSCLGSTAGFMAAFLFEEKYVKFGSTRVPHKFVLRTVFGLGLFVFVGQAMKLPFSEELLTSHTAAAYAIRTVRYAVSVFVSVGVYPMAFDKTKII